MPTCPICGSRPDKDLGRVADRRLSELLRGAVPGFTSVVVRCGDCAHVWATAIPDGAELADLYAATTGYFRSTEEVAAEGARGVVDRVIAAGSTSGRWLDIGCGRGLVMAAANDSGFESTGIEPTESFAALAKRFGTVHQGFLDDAFAPPRGFDAISMMAVLEHVADPLDMLRRAAAQANAGAVLIAEVPQAHRLEAMVLDRAIRISRRPWTVRTCPFIEPFHLSEWSRASISRALGSTGWELLEMEVIPGRVHWPLPAPAAWMIRGIERLGNRLGRGLNLTVVARRRR